jgi:succinate-acetate transporter protein
MCAKWTVKHEIMGQLLWFFFPVLAVCIAVLPFSYNHPYMSIAGYIGLFVIGGVFLWKRKR